MSADRWIVVWRVSEACDLACPFCRYSRSLRFPRAAADPAEVVRLGRLLGQASRQTGRPVLLSWLGGEPLRWPPIWEVSRMLHREAGLKISATTNGTALKSPRVRQAILADFAELTVSLDGPPEQHDALRGAPGVWNCARDGLRVLAEERARLGSGLRLRVNAVLMRETIDGLEALCETVAGWGVDELTFNALGGRDRPEFYPEHCLLPEQVACLRQTLPGLRERMARRGLLVRGAPEYLARLEASALGRAWPVDDCAPGQSFLFVDERGRISPCSFTAGEYGLPASQLRSVQDVLDLPRRLAERRRARPLEVCQNCPSTQVFGKFVEPGLERVAGQYTGRSGDGSSRAPHLWGVLGTR